MGFFAECITSTPVEIIVPDAYTLKILQVCLPPETKKSTSTLYVQPVNEEKGYALCCVNSTSMPHCALQHEFGPEDSPVTFWVTGNDVHLTGNWIWEIDESDNESEECSEDDCHEECGAECETHDNAESVDANASKKARKNNGATEVSSTVQTSTAESETAPKKTGRNKRGRPAAEIVPPSEDLVVVCKPPSDPDWGQRKRWKVKPENDEGVLVPTPKQRTLSSGVLITDHVIGRGNEPRLGSIVKITYEGLFPDGTIFDFNRKRTKPFKFRKGAGQVVRGLDLGLEGMRIGGSREIVIPPPLGYGEKGVGEIPGNQTLIFRVTLVGSEKSKK
mmetsp:Transcript_22483/g.32824  ORF Transcript_22483/g.32824 Transcript_22483/m.32824 type:complete len:333 (+) Transcript_22483:38-1036(+)